jgi:hypothetical protein
MNIALLIVAVVGSSLLEFRFRKRRRDQVIAKAESYPVFAPMWLARRVPSLILCIAVTLLTSIWWLGGALFFVFTLR